jgi:hypothetical protein
MTDKYGKISNAEVAKTQRAAKMGLKRIPKTYSANLCASAFFALYLRA